ncbi:MAG TPA: DUF72 domain-containing protein [Croceibacterium sp.]|jgi:uncharacterized protein YecE (DUF72 family)
MTSIRIGTAGWSIPRQVADAFPAQGTALERYASRFPVAEINSSFHRPHRISTWQRWRDSVPDEFRFSAKLPKTITHERKLVDCAHLLDEFMAQAGTLGEKLAVVLVQLPPKLEFDAPTATRFFAALGKRCSAAIACEPRHASWFDDQASALLVERRVCRVAADPAVCEAAAQPGGWRGLSYWRLHGSPVKYRSSYGDRIGGYAGALQTAATKDEAWCIFDNTASSAAASDALKLLETLG